MEKREALEVIINSLQIIPDELKTKLIDSIPALSDEAVDEIGKQLAMIKALSIHNQQAALKNFTKVMNEIEFPAN